MSKKKIETFQIGVEIKLITTHEVRALTLEDALAQGRALELRDVVEFEGDYIDGEIKVTGVY